MPRLKRGSLLPLKVFVERYGLDGHAPCSVHEAARRHRLTPAQVRALESRVLRTLKRAVGA